MRKAQRGAGLAVLLLVAAVGCDAVGPDDRIGSFEWAEREAVRPEASEAVLIGLDVLLIGDINTPTACFQISPAYQQSGTTGTLRIRASNRNATGCGDRTVTYGYEAFLREMGGVTTLIVIHDVQGVGTQEFTHDLMES